MERQRLPSTHIIACIIALWLVFGLVAVYCMRVPELKGMKEDEEDLSRQIQADHDKLNYQIGMEAYKRLDEKYGNHD